MNDVIQRLKNELAVRSTNEYVGSGSGGNTAQFYYTLTHDLGNVDLPENGTMFEIRQAFNRFWETCPDKNYYIDAHLADPEFLKLIPHSTTEVKMLIEALQTCILIRDRLDERHDIVSSIQNGARQESNKLHDNFLLRHNLPVQINLNDSPYHELFLGDSIVKHHIKRFRDIYQSLHSYEDVENYKKLAQFPEHIILFSVRNIITIDRLCKHMLDEETHMREVLMRVNRND